jgi:xylulose-5-phosphate/fructose-6-phosphate phosphoketolase
MKTKTPFPELLHKMNAYWRAANYLSLGQIYIYDNPLLKRLLTSTDHFTEGELSILTRSRR